MAPCPRAPEPNHTYSKILHAPAALLYGIFLFVSSGLRMEVEKQHLAKEPLRGELRKPLLMCCSLIMVAQTADQTAATMLSNVRPKAWWFQGGAHTRPFCALASITNLPACHACPIFGQSPFEQRGARHGLNNWQNGILYVCIHLRYFGSRQMRARMGLVSGWPWDFGQSPFRDHHTA